MAYSTEIEKTQISPFAELYRIVVGGAVYYYTSYSEDYIFQSNTYLKRPLKRSEFSFSDRLRAVRVRVSAPIAGPFLQFIATAPPQLIEIKITRVFVDTPTDYLQIFQGYVISVVIEGNVASVECESETRLLRNKIPKYLFQATCNHILFDAGCAILEGDYDVSAVLSGVTGPILVSSTFAGYADGYFLQGIVKFTHPTLGQDIRLITNHVGDTITLQVPFSGIAIGSTVTAYPGCDKSYDTCLAKFNNLANRLSFDEIPSSNPVMWGFQ